MNRPKLIALLIAATFLAASCASDNTNRTTDNAHAATPVIALSSVEQFATAFDADKGVPRLILPISPT